MTSAISTSNIDGDYPYAGVDNNSQGFRDNFTNIKIALDTASGEISTLQSNTAKLNDDNNFLGNNLVNAIYKNLRGEVSGLGNSSGTVSRSAEFPYHYLTITGTTTISLTDWPDTGYACTRIEIRGGTTTANVTFSSSPPPTGTYKDVDFPSPFTVLQDERHIVEAWSYNNGSTVFLKYIGKFEEV